MKAIYNDVGVRFNGSVGGGVCFLFRRLIYWERDILVGAIKFALR